MRINCLGRCTALLLVLVRADALRTPPPPTRRQALQRYALPCLGAVLGLPAAPRSALAACSCPKGFDSCVCDGEKGDATKGALGPKRRADAAGRDLQDTLRESRELQEYIKLTEDPKALAAAEKKAKAEYDKRAKQAKAAVDAPPPPGSDIQVVGTLGLSGGGGQGYGDVDVAGAKQRFREIVMQTARKREAEYGFELDAADIKQIEDVLRPKYCGKEGLIGPC